MRRTASLKYYLKNPKKNGKLRDVEVSIIYKFTAPGGRFEDPTGLWINPRYWDFKRQEAKPINEELRQLNQKLLQIKKTKLELFEKYGYDFAQFESVARGLSPIIEEEKKNPASAIASFYKHHLKGKAHDTVTAYTCMFKYFEPFKGLPFDKLDWSFFDQFKRALYDADLVDATVKKYIEYLKTFLNWSLKRGYPVNLVFKGWSTPSKFKTRISLTLEELERLEKAMLPVGPGIGRDFLCLEARTGQRISDLLAFDKRDFDGKAWTFNQKKTGQRVRIPRKGFIAPAFNILEKYNFKMPQYTRRHINVLIRQACDIVNINQLIADEKWQEGKRSVKDVEKWTKITSHTGRRTFMTLGLQFIKNAKFVKDLAGVTWQTIRHYEGESEAQFIDEALEDMADKINKRKAG